ncbi:MAG: hypothetical protein Q9203_006070 [Teloschistes exilis]
MGPIVYFLALAFVDNAFHPELIQAGLTVRQLHSFACPSGTIDFSFREEILTTPVFRSSSGCLYGKQTSGSRASSANTLGRWFARLGQRAGLPHPITPYCFQREVATSLTDAGVSQPQLLQILGHRKVDTYLRHYQSTEVRVDVQATFLGTTSKANMIKEIGRLCIRDDSNLPRSLTPEQRIQVLRDPVRTA